MSISNVVFGVSLVVMAAISIHYSGRIAEPRLPMQWGFNGKATWHAPRLVALWFSLGVAILVRLLILLLETYDPSNLRGASLGLILFSIIITIVHLVHMSAAARWAARQ